MSVHVAFRVAGQGYALPYDRIREVIRVQYRVRVPHAPAVVWGVINHRGRIYAAFDTSLWVTNGARSYKITSEACAILLDSSDTSVALLVDGIEGSGHPEPDETAEEDQFGSDSARIEGMRVRLLDTDRLLMELNRMIEHVSQP